MPILVVCPGCRKSFKVSEKFAGKKGSCPKCKHEITVPTEAQEVKVHAPQAFASGGKTTSGELITKPIARQDAKFTPVAAAALGSAVLVVLLVALVGGKVGLWKWWSIAPALVLLSPPLAFAAYTFLRDDELEPYRGNALYVRTLICGVVYALLWGAFEYVGRTYFNSTPEIWMWLVILPPFVLVGGLAALATYDLDFGTGTMHYSFYILVTLILRVTASILWPWQQLGG